MPVLPRYRSYRHELVDVTSATALDEDEMIYVTLLTIRHIKKTSDPVDEMVNVAVDEAIADCTLAPCGSSGGKMHPLDAVAGIVENTQHSSHRSV